MVSMVLLHSDFEPQMTPFTSTGGVVSVGMRELNTNFVHNEEVGKSYEKMAAANQGDGEPQRLQICGKTVAAAPILSTNLSEPLYRQYMPCDPFELTTKQLKAMHRNFIPLTKS